MIKFFKFNAKSFYKEFKEFCLAFLFTYVFWMLIGFVFSLTLDNKSSTSYQTPSSESLIGKYITINNEKVIIVNHNFWSSTYTLSNGVTVDDNYVEDIFKYKVTETNLTSMEFFIKYIKYSSIIYLVIFVLFSIAIMTEFINENKV